MWEENNFDSLIRTLSDSRCLNKCQLGHTSSNKYSTRFYISRAPGGVSADQMVLYLFMKSLENHLLTSTPPIPSDPVVAWLYCTEDAAVDQL